MAISLISPGVKITESEILSSVQATGTTIGATAGQFRWGPIEQPTLVTSEKELVEQFGGPNATNTIDFMSSAIYLGYSPALYVVRTNATSANNATASGVATQVKNDDFYEKNFVTGSETSGSWVAKHSGLMGNSLKVSTCPSAAAFQSTLTGSYTTTSGSKTVVGASSTANTQLTVGDTISLLSETGGTTLRTFSVASTVNTTHITLTTAPTFSSTTTTPTRKWQYAYAFDGAPGTSAHATKNGGVGDEMHIAVIDEDGLFSGGELGKILEKFTKVSKGSDARKAGNRTNFYKNIINDLVTGSKYIRWGNKDSQGTNWETTVVNKTFTAVSTPINYSLSGGVDGTVTDAFRISAFSKLANKSTVSASLLFTGSASATVVNSVVANVAEVRKDLVVCFSPALTDCQSTDLEVAAIKTFADTVTPSTYAFMDANWQWMADPEGTYSWIPSNAATAGRMAATDQQSAPWFSPAGYVNGSLGTKVDKLAWNPTSEERDELYKYGINPIISEIGRGFFLFGDKTFTTEAGSFNRINVRRLFITIEKTIGDIASNLLFGINDDATRTSFTNTVEPYLRTVQARRGIIEFKFVCDASNNSDASVNDNEFTADIFIRPVSSINFIQLNFVSVGGAAQFAALG